ncbi:MAG: hypothetical protein WD995_00645 [Gemmatimonadota bacterium]
MLTALIWFGFGALAVLGGLAVRRRVARSRARDRHALDDDAVRRIVDTGRFSVDEDPPLDIEEIEEAEDRFWSETWDQPEEDW